MKKPSRLVLGCVCAVSALASIWVLFYVGHLLDHPSWIMVPLMMTCLAWFVVSFAGAGLLLSAWIDDTMNLD